MHAYLSRMGIDTWTLRQNIESVFPACYAYELLHQGEEVGLLFAASASEDSAVVQLLGKMMAALQCQSRGQWYSTQPDYSEFANLRFVITLGDGFEVDSATQHIHSHSPQCLIAKPALKAETWASLQAVFPLLSNSSNQR